MIVVRNKLIPFKGFKCINICGVLFCRENAVLQPNVIEHERIHTKQMGDLLYLFPLYYLWYIAEWLIRLCMTRDTKKAYKAILFEQEAYIHEYEIGYHKTRKHFAWLKNQSIGMSCVIALPLLLSLYGCKTQYVPVETVRTEYVERTKELRDTTVIHDSTFVYRNGDTLYITQWRDRWRTVYKQDTLLVNRTDSVQVPYPVEKKLNRWEQFKVDYSGYVIGILLASLVLIIVVHKNRARSTIRD